MLLDYMAEKLGQEMQGLNIFLRNSPQPKKRNFFKE